MKDEALALAAAVPDQILSIKLEIDTRPPAGAVLQHYDRVSPMAGKIHALMIRGYPKGRDWYDLAWYRGHRPPLEPNLDQLQNALSQTQGENVLSSEEWKTQLLIRLEEIDCQALRNDVAPFLERPEEVKLLNRQNLQSVLGFNLGNTQ